MASFYSRISYGKTVTFYVRLLIRYQSHRPKCYLIVFMREKRAYTIKMQANAFEKMFDGKPAMPNFQSNDHFDAML